MTRFFLIILLCLPLNAWAQEAVPVEHSINPVIGVLFIPSIFSYSSEVTETPVLPVYENPQVAAATVAMVSRDVVQSERASDLYLPELAYEENGFEVIGQQEGWFHVQIRRAGSAETVAGWVLPPADAYFTEMSVFLQKSLLDFSDAWSGKLYKAEGSAEEAAIKPSVDKVTGADVQQVVLHEGAQWALVKLRHICSEDDEVYATGWVQVPTDWRALFVHYSRGC